MATDRDPNIEYSQRLEARRKTVAHLERKARQVAVLRLVTSLVFIAIAWLSLWEHTVSIRWLFAPAAVFLGLVVIHDRVNRAKERGLRAVTFYEDGLARIEDRWIGRGQSTKSFRGESHLYAADLDIFGSASLFELLCTARTLAGEETLATWLAEPSAREEIIARQQAVDELRYRIDLREDLAILGASIHSAIHPELMTQWGNSDVLLDNPAMRVVLPVLAAVTLLILFLGPTYGDGYPVWPIAFAVEAAVGQVYRRRVLQVIGLVDRPERELSLLSLMLARIEREEFHSEKLVQLRRNLDATGMPPSRQIGRLARLMDLLNWRRNEFFAPFAAIVFWATQLTFATESWKRRCGPFVGDWLRTVGEFEALCALSAFAYEHPNDPFPEIAATGPVMRGIDLRHPLIPNAQCVPNSLDLGGELQLLVVSGSNMSGKSTLLRTVGINAVLALAGAPVRAKSLKLSPMAIGATLRIQDSLQAGTSRFYAEVQRIHQIMESTKGPMPVLFLLDEVLHGTNSHDRAVGAEAILRGLIDRGAVGLVTTHDLALTKVAEALTPRAANVHFEDEMVAGRMVFDYRMKAGIVLKSNALALMRAVGLEV